MWGLSSVSCRDALLQEFERAGVGVSVMKPFAGGQLLDAAQSERMGRIAEHFGL